MKDIVVMGSSVVDCFVDTGIKIFNPKKRIVLFPFGSKIIIDDIKFYVGGGGANVSVGLSRLGFNVSLITKIGRGLNSQRIIKKLKNESVNTSFVISKEGRTGFSVILDAKGHDRTILVFKGSSNNIGLNEINLKKIKCEWIYTSSLMGKSFDTMKRVVSYAVKHHIKVYNNPSEYLVKKRKLYIPFLRYVNILSLNKEESALLCKEVDVKKALKKISSYGPEIVIITDGINKIHAYDGKFMYIVTPHQKRVVEATGAGDAFGSGFLAGYIKTGNVEEALVFGLLNAESVISYHGAQNKLLTWNQLIKTKKSIKTVIKKRLMY